MVVHDELFKKDLTKMRYKDLLRFRKEQVSNLFNGLGGSIDNLERTALIKEVDIEREMRFKKRTEIISIIALVISIIAVSISIISFYR